MPKKKTSRRIVRPKSTCTVADCMTKIPIDVDIKTTLMDAAKLMKKMDISSVIVKDQGSIVGIVTEKDMTRRVVAKGLDPTVSTVEAIMSHGIISASPTMSVQDCANLMLKHNIKHMPVVHNGMMLGIITAMGILRAEPECLQCIVDIGKKRKK